MKKSITESQYKAEQEAIDEYELENSERSNYDGLQDGSISLEEWLNAQLDSFREKVFKD